jgi:ferredoxin
MNPNDGKSDLVNAKWKGEEFMVSTIDESEYDDNKKAADACPVNIIRLD